MLLDVASRTETKDTHVKKIGHPYLSGMVTCDFNNGNPS
jgi:hypothetical protein